MNKYRQATPAQIRVARGGLDKKRKQKIRSVARCRYCRRTVPKVDRTVDHIIPLCKGGTNAKTNLAMACRSCNDAKKNMTEVQFLEWLGR